MSGKIISKLKSFDDSSWIDFIQKLLYREDTTPSLISVSTELHQQLFWIYNTFEETDKPVQRRFTETLLQVLDTSEPTEEMTEAIYICIFFILKTKPAKHRDSIAAMVRHRKFENLSFGGRNLHLLLIKAYINIEDRKKLLIEEYLKNSGYRQEPYFLYLIFYYYGYLHYPPKALDAFGKYLQNTQIDEEVSEEIYFALRDCIPDYVNLLDFLERVLKKEIVFDLEIPSLKDAIYRFCEYLFDKTDVRKFACFASDVLKNEYQYFPQEYDVEYNKRSGKPSTKFDELVSEHTQNYIDNESEDPVPADTSTAELMNQTLQKNSMKIAILDLEDEMAYARII